VRTNVILMIVNSMPRAPSNPGAPQGHRAAHRTA
jgi:hypothetical protein